MLRSPVLHSRKTCLHSEHPGLVLLVSYDSYPLARYEDHQEGTLRRP
jgi:hypothetical protein